MAKASRRCQTQLTQSVSLTGYLMRFKHHTLHDVEKGGVVSNADRAASRLLASNLVPARYAFHALIQLQ